MVNVTWQEQNQSICPVFDILHSIMQTRAAIDLGEAVGLGNNGLLGEMSININGGMGSGEGWMDESEMITMNQEIKLERDSHCTTSTEDAAMSRTDIGVNIWTRNNSSGY